MLSALLVLAAQAAPAQPMTATVLHMQTTGAAVRLDLPDPEPDVTVLNALKRRYADRAILQGKLRGDGTIMVVTAYGEPVSSQEWRKELMKGKLVGLGQFELGATACTESVKELEAPYANMSWHAFLTMADTCFDVSIGTLAKDGVAPISRQDFEHCVQSARYAILRLCTWDEMPASVLEHMHAGLSRAEQDAVAFLSAKANSAEGDWSWALAAAEVGSRMKTPAADRLALYDRVLADLAKIEERSAGERVAGMTASSGRAIALRDEGRFDEALAALDQAQGNEAAKSKLATAELEYARATILARKLDAPATIAHLKLAIAADEDRRVFATRDNSFQGIGTNAELVKLLSKPRK